MTVLGPLVGLAQPTNFPEVRDLMNASRLNLERWERQNQGVPVLPRPADRAVSTETSEGVSPTASHISGKTSSAMASFLKTRPTGRNFGQAEPTVPPLSGARGTVDEKTTFYFLSFAMPNALMQETLRTLGSHDVAVFRGPVKGETMVDFSRRLSHLLGKPTEKSQTVGIHVDPVRFRQCAVQSVPATCIITAEGPLTVHGALSGDYLGQRRSAPGGVIGPTWPIAEIDLSLELKKRLNGITKETFRREVVKSVFLNRGYVTLPRAEQEAAFMFDPSVMRRDPVVVAGQVLTHQNQQFNPVAAIGGFRHSYLIFDASDARQLAAAQKLLPSFDKMAKPVRVIVSKLDQPAEGFDAVARLRRQLGRQVTILDEALARSLRLRALPSVVESTPDGKIIVNELKS